MTNMSMLQLKKTLINLVQSPAKMWKPRESQIFVRTNRALKWRDQEILEGRILTVIAVPNELVNEVLAISGKHGLIIDLARRDVKEEHEKECANVRLPEEWGIKEALKKLEEMPKQAKEVTKGIVPTRKGFALRVAKQAEGDITSLLNPAEATRLGPAMGIKPKSAWVIKGVPAYADTGMIVKTVAQSSQSWPGWIVRPRRPLTSNRGRVTTWLVDAVVEPPAAVITLNGFIISIEKYTESTTTNKRASAWMSISPKLNHEIVLGRIYEDEDAVENAEAQREENLARMVAKTVKVVAKDVVMQQAPNQEVEERATKRKIAAEGEAAKEAVGNSAASHGENADMMKRLLDKLDQKDEQIAQMFRTIEGLRAQIQTLSDRLGPQSQTEENDI